MINQVESLFKRPNFAQKCEQWRERDCEDDVYSDVYDGKVWKDFDL